MNMKRTLRGMASVYALTATIAALTATTEAASITVDSVAQRWPWNNKVDITYTVAGGQDVAGGVYARIVFTANIGGTAYTIDGVHDVGASASDGTHTVTWTLPSGLKATGCTMTARLLSADNPSGDDYMIVDLSTGEITYEGLFATQETSNTRYNTSTYKTSKLVLRKVPAGTHRTGTTGTNFREVNTAKEWTTDRDYYIGVFELTRNQYYYVCGGTNPNSMAPQRSMTWNDFRGETVSTNAVVASATGSFLQRLNYKTGLYFDLPTEVMFEIAMRAGTTGDFYWGGDSVNTDYVYGYTSGYSNPTTVGSKKPNAWGLYDMAGNVWNFCLDDNSLANLADATDPFTPAYSGNASRRARGGAYNVTVTNPFRSPDHTDGANSATASYNSYGYRVAYIVK